MAQLRSVSELKVVSLARGLPAGIMVKLLTEAGASVTTVDPPGGDPFAAIHPAYPVWYAGAAHGTESDVNDLLADADVCLVGGEAHPDLTTHWQTNRLAEQHPRLVVVDIRALDPGRPEDVPAVEILVQAAMGLATEHRSSSPMVAAMHPGSYGAALLGLLGLFAALVARERTSRGQVVTTSLEQGIALSWNQLWMDSIPHDPAFDVVAPRDLQHLILQGRDGKYLQLTYGVPGAVRKVYDVLGLETDASETDPGGPRSDRGPRNYYGIYDELAAGVSRFDRDDVLERLRAVGIPAEPVLAPGECWDGEQVQANDFLGRDAGSRHVGRTLIHRAAPPAASDHTEPPSEAVEDDAPLKGLRILDFGTLVAGPYASTLLTALGATVTKIESASARPSAATVRNGFAVGPSKQSACLDLKSPEGAGVLARICQNTDVVHHNFRVGAADRLGLDPVSLWAINPGVVTLTTTAFGLVGPKAFDRGLDMVVAAMTGHQVRAGAQEPTWYRAPAIDYVCGAMGAIGILMSYMERLRFGEAPAVENSLLGAALFLQQDLVERDGHVSGLPQLESDGLGTSPWERIYECADGWVAVAARNAKQRAGLLEVTGMTDYGPETDPGRLEATVGAALRERPADAVVAECAAASVWAVRCAHDAWERLRSGFESGVGSMVAEVADPVYGRVVGCFGQLVEFSEWAGPTRPRPGLAGRGQHTALMLEEAGFSPEEQAELFERGVVS